MQNKSINFYQLQWLQVIASVLFNPMLKLSIKPIQEFDPKVFIPISEAVLVYTSLVIVAHVSYMKCILRECLCIEYVYFNIIKHYMILHYTILVKKDWKSSNSNSKYVGYHGLILLYENNDLKQNMCAIHKW